MGDENEPPKTRRLFLSSAHPQKTDYTNAAGLPAYDALVWINPIPTPFLLVFTMKGG